MSGIDQRYLEEYRDNDWMETFTGRQFWPARPRLQDITIFDIAHALALKCRYGGHCDKFYSVGEHCWILAVYARRLGLPVSVQLELLLHDAGEAYLPDVPRPIKHHFPELVVMERRIDELVRRFAGLTGEVPSCVKEFDSRIIVDERAQNMGRSGLAWQVDALQPLGVSLSIAGPSEVQWNFLSLYQLLTHELHGKPAFLWYKEGEFDGTLVRQAGGTVYDEVKGVLPDIRAIDLAGKCILMYADDGNGGKEPRFVNGECHLYHGPSAGPASLEAPGG